MKTLFANGFRPANNPFEGRGARLGAFPGFDFSADLPGIPPIGPFGPPDIGLPPAPPAPPPPAPPAPPPATPPPTFEVRPEFLFPVTAGYLACPTGPGMYNLLDPVSFAVVRTGVGAPLPAGTTVLAPSDGRCGVVPAPAATYATPAAAPAPSEIPTGVYVGGAILGLGILALLTLS